MKRLARYLAARRLAKMVERNRQSYEIVDYRKRREAAKRGLQRRREALQ